MQTQTRDLHESFEFLSNIFFSHSFGEKEGKNSKTCFIVILILVKIVIDHSSHGLDFVHMGDVGCTYHL